MSGNELIKFLQESGEYLGLSGPNGENPDWDAVGRYYKVTDSERAEWNRNALQQSIQVDQAKLD